MNKKVIQLSIAQIKDWKNDKIVHFIKIVVQFYQMKNRYLIIFFIKFEKITCKCKICDIINVTKIINQNKNKNLRAKEDREWRLNSLMMKQITYQKDKSAKRYARGLPLSSVKFPRWLANLARKMFLILENSRFLGGYFCWRQNIKIVFEIGKYVFNYASISLGKIEQKYYWQSDK